MGSAAGIVSMSFSDEGSTWSPWQPYAGSAPWLLPPGDGPKPVYARFRDTIGRVSLPISSTIALDTAAGAEYAVSINDGALFTNQPAVTLAIGARPGTAQMQVSNDGGFAGAAWEPYASHRAWMVTQYGTYVIPRTVYVRFKDVAGNVSTIVQDDIILDVTPPQGSVQILVPARHAAGLGSPPTRTPRVTRSTALTYRTFIPSAAYNPSFHGAVSVTLLLAASDDVSGVGGMIVSSNPSFTGSYWQPFGAQMSWVINPAASGSVYVKYRDYAMNVSPVYSATLR
jgi:hypothetical protein